MKLTKEEIAAESALRYRDAFSWLIKDERDALRYALQTALDMWYPGHLPATHDAARRLLKAIKEP